MTDTTQTAFSFVDRDAMIRAATKQDLTRQSNTVRGSVEHALVHTPNPNVTIHHVVTAACPHLSRERSDEGEYYMIAYISIPMDWIDRLSGSVQNQWDISFIGPSGRVQALPPALSGNADILGDRYYVGFDWLWLHEENGKTNRNVKQPTIDYIKTKLITFATVVRELAP